MAASERARGVGLWRELVRGEASPRVRAVRRVGGGGDGETLTPDGLCVCVCPPSHHRRPPGVLQQSSSASYPARSSPQGTRHSHHWMDNV